MINNIDIYFALTKAQQRKFDLKHSYVLMELVTLNEFMRITKNKKIITQFKAWKWKNDLRIAC